MNSRVFLWPKDMEQVLDLSATRIAHRREIAEGVLRNKGAEFEQVYVSTTIPPKNFLFNWLNISWVMA